MTRRDSKNLHGLGIAFLMIAVLSCVSCATRGEFSDIRHEIDSKTGDVESRLSSLEQRIARIDSLVEEQLMLTQSLSARIGTQSREQREQISTITSRQDDINYLLKDLLEKLQAIQLYGGMDLQPSTTPPSPSKPSGNSVPQTTSTPSISPEKLYETALQDVEDENFILAENRFITFLLRFPKHTLAPNAQYWLGETYYAQEMYAKAITEFETVTKKYKKSPKVRAALLKIGFAQIEMGNTKKGKATLQKITKSYRKSAEAKTAREKLKNID